MMRPLYYAFARARLRIQRPRDRRWQWVINDKDLAYLVDIGIYPFDPEWADGINIEEIFSARTTSSKPLPFKRPPEE